MSLRLAPDSGPLPSPSRRALLVALAASSLSSLLGCGAEPAPPPRAQSAEVVIAPTTAAASAAAEDTGPPAPSEWKIGASLDYTSWGAKFDLATRRGIELAAEEVNARGGVKGIPVHVLFVDHKADREHALRNLRRLIDRDKVVALLGDTTSSMSRIVGALANAKGIPMITPSATHPDVTQVGPFVFRSCFADDAQGRAAARFAINVLGKKQLAVLYASDLPYSTLLASEFRAEAARLGVSVAVEDSFAANEITFGPVLKRVKALKSDLVYAPIFTDQIAALVRQGKTAGLTADMFVGGDAWDALSPEERADLEGAHFTSHYAADDPSPRVAGFVARFKARFDEEPPVAAATGYDGAGLLADAIGRARDATPGAIREAIAATKAFPGVTGDIAIDAERNAHKRVLVLTIKGGAYHYHSPIQP